MIKKFTLFIFLFSLSTHLVISSTLDIEKQTSQEAQKIALREQTKGTRSGTTLCMNAVLELPTVTIFVENFTGNVSTLIFGMGGTQTSVFYSNHTGQDVIDISFLPNGQYTIQIEVAGKTYVGFFEINR